MKKEEGTISLFVVIILFLLLVFSISTYLMLKNQNQIQEEKYDRVKEMYSENLEISYADSNEVIPIYTIEELNLVGTGDYERIDEKIYQCGRGMQYVLKNNIIIDINEDVVLKKIKSNDYKLYSSSYYMDDANYSVLYFINDMYLKNLFYENKSKEKENLNDNYTENYFSLINDYKFNIGENYNFVFLAIDENGNLETVKTKSQTINSNIQNIYQINVYSENIGNTQKNDEVYLFVEEKI